MSVQQYPVKHLVIPAANDEQHLQTELCVPLPGYWQNNHIKFQEHFKMAWTVREHFDCLSLCRDI